MHYWLIMPAAGSGRRFRESAAAHAATSAEGAGAEPGSAAPAEWLPKQYAQILGRTLIEWALAPFAADARCAGIVLALAPEDPHWPRIAKRVGVRTETVRGGDERCHSVRAALAALTGRLAAQEWVLVHDAARPCLARADIDRLLAECAEQPAGGLLGAPAADTLKVRGPDREVERTLDRRGVWRALTPQMFRFGPLCAALDAAFATGRLPTDEAQALEWAGARPLIVSGSPFNIKVTTAEDLSLAAALLAGPSREAAAMRIGSGFDVHAFGPGDFVMLGGVRIAHTHGVVAHSDGDVVLHAVCDGLLGAAGLGDIGQHFRDDDSRWRGADSSGFVRAVLEMVHERGLRVVNADVTVLAEAPRVAHHREAMVTHLARLLQVPSAQVNLKATTTERLGFLGRGEGLAAHAVVLLESTRPSG